jgi:hypothetical protein
MSDCSAYASTCISQVIHKHTYTHVRSVKIKIKIKKYTKDVSNAENPHCERNWPVIFFFSFFAASDFQVHNCRALLSSTRISRVLAYRTQLLRLWPLAFPKSTHNRKHVRDKITHSTSIHTTQRNTTQHRGTPHTHTQKRARRRHCKGKGRGHIHMRERERERERLQR